MAVKWWSNGGQIIVKWCEHGGKRSSRGSQTVVKQWSNDGKTMVKQWSNNGQTMVKMKAHGPCSSPRQTTRTVKWWSNGWRSNGGQMEVRKRSNGGKKWSNNCGEMEVSSGQTDSDLLGEHGAG